MASFLETLHVQRMDDHRYYHQSRINQSLHLVSALSFLLAYGMLFFDPAVAALIGWLVSMTSRQAGHFFFEPKGYDYINQATHEHKEAIKVGYNLERKVVLMGIWAASPIAVVLEPSLFGLLPPVDDDPDYLRRIGLVWLAIGMVGLLFRMIHLFMVKDVQTGIVWVTKILTDPFHDVKLYYKAPFHLMRGQLYDPMRKVGH